MPNTKPHVHKRSSSGEAMCGRGGSHPRLTAYTDEVTCTYCALGVTGVSGHSVHPLPASVLTARWNRLRAYVTEERAAQDQLAADHAELGHDDQSERAYGAVEALDGLLATMERLEARQ